MKVILKCKFTIALAVKKCIFFIDLMIVKFNYDTVALKISVSVVMVMSCSQCQYESAVAGVGSIERLNRSH